jgi:CRP-like cAMP-binding protein
MPDYSSLLKQADIFYQIPPGYLEMVAAICQERRYQAGENVFLEGSGSDDLYVILQGEVDILVNPGLVSDQPGVELPSVTIATLRRGQSFGEIALVDQGVRSATACAATNETRMLVIPRKELIQLCDLHPDLGYRLMRNLAADLAMKIRNTDLLIREELLFNAKQN